MALEVASRLVSAYLSQRGIRSVLDAEPTRSQGGSAFATYAGCVGDASRMYSLIQRKNIFRD